MPATTRHATGNSRPRQFLGVSTDPVTKRGPTTKRKTTTTTKTTGAKVGRPKGGTTTATGRVAKPATGHKRKPTLADKVKGAVKKATGAVERKPGKKAAGTAEMRGHDGKKKTAKKI